MASQLQGLELLNPPIQRLEDLVNHTIVTIAIQTDPQGKRKIRMYPRRAEDVVTYSTPDGETEAPEKPREVRWIVRGKAPDETVRILAKKPGNGPMRDQYDIEGPINTLVSGRATKAPPDSERHGRVWSYTIELRRGTERLDFIDPDVVVKSDP